MSLIPSLARYRLLPALILDDVGMAKDVASALIAGDLPILEVTLRTPNALSVLSELAHVEDLCLGAGTVLNVDQAKAALDAGARYLVAPGLNPQVAEFAHAQGIPLLPGAVTASEMMLALELGCPAVKFFPAEAMGGLPSLRALSGPLPQMRYVPTGGIHSGNLAAYLDNPKVIAVGGSWMLTPSLLKARDFSEITRLASEARKIAVHASSPEA